MDPGRPDNIYAALEVSGVIRSADGGETWTDLSQPLIRLADKPHLKSRIGSAIDSEGMLDSHALAVSSAAPGTAFLAVRMNGAPLTADHGAPVRLVVPSWYGCSWIKWVDRLSLVGADAPTPTHMVEFLTRTQQSGITKLARD